jgi:hypothetical protein
LITDLIDLFNELIEYKKSIKPKEDDPNDIQNQMKKIDQMIEQYLVKLPSLLSVEEKELLISNIETNLKIRKKQFYYVILYYMINKHWPYIKKQSPSLVRLRAFFTLLHFLLDNQILEKFDENSNGGQ